MAIDETREFLPLNIAVLTISDSRSPIEDVSGNRLVELLRATGIVSRGATSSMTRPT